MEFLKNFTKTANETPNRTAVVDMNGSRRTTYGELDKMSGKVYGYLKEKGIGREDFVVVSLPRGVAPVAAMLGVMKAGAAYVMIEEGTPPERSAFITKDCRCRMRITPDVWKDIEAAEILSGFEEVADHNAAFVVYTSGTTGVPKGVVHEFGNIDRIINSYENSGELATLDSDTMAMVTPVSFVAANTIIYITLAMRIELHVIPLTVVKNPKAFEEYLADQNINAFFVSPTLYRVLNHISPSVRLILLSSEAVSNIWSHGRTYCALYTSSELAVIFAYFVIDKSYELTPIGKPSVKFKYKIIDDAGAEVHEGEIGELCVENPYVRGYLNLPEQTAAAFEKDHMYHTGDLVRELPDGNLVVIGRKDEMIKIAGNRVEPAEIEAAAKKALNLSNCIAKGVTGDNYAYICLYYTDDTEFNTDEAREKLSEIIPYYMLPSHFIKLDAMPLTPTGKVNRKALPLPEIRRKSDGWKPETQEEIFFVQAFASVLGLDESDVYADENFFRIGGTSISAMKVVIAANNAEYKLTYADVFANPTPQTLAKCAASKGEFSQTADIRVAPRSEGNSIDLLLERNTLDSFRSGGNVPLGRVLLCGATGYTGVHVLRELLENTDSDVTCLVRSKRGTDPLRRLASRCFYYFSEDFTEKYADRLSVAVGDITKCESLSGITGIDTVINCAANVKHFSAGNDIEEINYDGVLNLIDYCKATGARLVQTSTLSVSGIVEAKSNAILTEQRLNIGQITVGNKYLSSKYKAEEAILTAICEGEIEAKIMRLGNLSPRDTDGEFQINFKSNASMERIKSHYLIGCYPYNFYDVEYEVSPIDSTARAIVLLSQTPRDCTVFHPCNPNKISFGDLLRFADEVGLKMSPVESEEYRRALSEGIKSTENIEAFTGILAYASDSEGLRFASVDETYTKQVLLRLGFRWPFITERYVRKFIECLKGLGFFE